jgi:hypothetical protein
MALSLKDLPLAEIMRRAFEAALGPAAEPPITMIFLLSVIVISFVYKQ